jgi:hypothetical protein
MNRETEQLDDKPWYRQFWPWFLIALPATVVVASIATFIIANSQPLEVDPTYARSGFAVTDDGQATDPECDATDDDLGDAADAGSECAAVDPDVADASDSDPLQP